MDFQTDGLAGVVRVFLGDEVTELDPDDAESFGEELIRAARDVRTEQATFGDTAADDGQLTLAEGSGDDLEPLAALLDEEPDDIEIGDVLNENDPLKW